MNTRKIVGADGGYGDCKYMNKYQQDFKEQHIPKSSLVNEIQGERKEKISMYQYKGD
jgi:hypothetical protein